MDAKVLFLFYNVKDVGLCFSFVAYYCLLIQ